MRLDACRHDAYLHFGDVVWHQDVPLRRLCPVLHTWLCRDSQQQLLFEVIMRWPIKAKY